MDVAQSLAMTVLIWLGVSLVSLFRLTVYRSRSSVTVAYMSKCIHVRLHL